MSYSCAFDLYNARKVMHFVARPSSCTGSGHKLINFKKDYPVYSCRKEHGGFAARQKRFQFPSGIYGHGPAGLMRYVNSLSQCAPRSQPNETPVTLPARVDRLFCAAKRGGELRWVSRASACNRREFPVRLAKLSGGPVANADQGTTDEDHGTTVSVLANDRNTPSSHSNAGLQVASTDTTGTKGNITVNADGTIAYSPNGQFEALKVGQSATDSFKYRAKRGTRTSAPATVTIKVDGVNDLPVANNDSASTDSAHTKSISVLSNDTDADDDSLSVSVDTAGTQGNVTVNGDGTVTYDPNHKFDSLGPNDTAHDTFKYKANDGHGDSNVATVDVTIGGIDDPPVVTTTAPALHYTEGDPATVLDAGVTVSDPDSAKLQSGQIKIVDGHNFNDVLHLPNPPDDPVPPAPGGITGFYDTNAGVLSLTAPAGGASKADWQAALRTVTFQSNSDNPFPTKTLEFTVNDGNSDSAISTKTITTTNVNDPPEVQASGGTSDFTEDSPAVAVDPGFNVTDPDSLQLQSATIAITGNFSSADGDTLHFTDQNGITHSYNAGTGVLTLTGVAAISDYQTAIQSITFDNTSNTPSTADRTVSITVKDAGGLDSNTDTKAVTVTAHNDAPTATDQSGLTTNEDTGLPVTLAGTDPENDSLTFTHDSTSAQGGTITGSGANVTYTPAQDYCSSPTPDSFNFTADDGNGGTDQGTVSITVTCVNDAPVVDLNGAGAGSNETASFTEDSPAASVAPNAVLTDVDNTSLASATITLTNHPDGAAESLAVTIPGGNPVTASSYDSGTGVLTLTGNGATISEMQTVIRSLTYNNTSNTPDTTDRVVNVKVNDGAADSNEPHSTVSVAAHNDAPTATDQSGLTTNEDTGLPVTLAGTDPENDSLTFTHDATSAQGGTISGSGANVTYTPAQDFCSATPDTFNFTADDGNGGTDQGTVSITVTCVNDAPVVDLNGAPAGSNETASFTEDSPAASVAPNAVLTDVDNTSLASATITLTNHPDGTTESLAVTIPGGNPVTASSYDSGTGVLTLTGNGATISEMQTVIRSLTYNNTSQNPDITDRVINVKVNDGAADSNEPHTTMSVSRHNDAPTATDQTGVNGLTTPEDTALPITLAGTDPENDSLSFTHDSVSAQGGTITGVGASVTYTPPQDFCSATPDSFGFTVDDGNGGTDSGTVEITVTCVNDAPVVDLNGAGAGTGNTVTFSEQITHTGGDVPLAPSGTVTDVDSDNISSLTVTLVNHPDGAAEHLTADTTGTPSITADAYDSSTGVLLLHGIDTKAHYQQVLQTISYRNDAAPPDPTSRDITFVAQDQAGADSAAAHATVSVVPINAPPVVDLNGTGTVGLDANASFTEGAGPATLAPSADVTDADDPNLTSATVTLTNRPDGGAESLAANVSGTSITADAYAPATGVLFLHGSDTVANYQQVIRSLTYDNTSDTPDPANRSITVKVNDGQDDSNVATVTLSVTPTNDPPALDLNGASAGVNETASYTEDTPATNLAPNALASDPDNANLQSATVTLTNHPDGAAESLSVDTTGTSISAVAYNSGTGVLSLSGSDTVSHYQDVLRTIKYLNTSQNADATSRVVNFVVNDGSNDSNSPTVSVTITVVNDPPVVDMNGGGSGIDSSAAFIEDSAPLNPGSGPVNLGASATVSDVDNTTLQSATLTVTNHPDGVNESLAVTIPGGNPITTGGYNASTGVLQLTGNGATLAQFQTVIQSAKYNNVSNTPDPTDRDVTIKVNDGTADSTVAHTTVSVTPTNDAPTAGDETFNATNSAIGNTTLDVNDTANHGGTADGRIATPDPTDTAPVTDRPHKDITGDIIANDSDPETGNSGLTATAGTFATNDGGSVTIQSDGDFVFEPSPSTSCTDTSDFFDYTVSDGNGGTDTGRVTVAITGCVWYVNNNDSGGNSGTSEKPFDTVAQAQTASSAGDSIFVYDGDNGTTGYNTGITLKSNQKLLSEAADLVIGSDTLHSADAANKASLTNNNADVVTLAAGSTVKGFNIDPQGTGGGVFGGSLTGTSTLTLDDLNIVDNGTKGTQAGLELNANTATTTTNISNLTVNNGDASSATTGDVGVKLSSAGTVNFADTGTISITTNGAAGLDAASTNLGTASKFDDITVTNSGSGGVLLSSTTGSGTSFGDGSGTDLSLTTVSGAPAAFSAQTAGSFSVPSGGTADVHATGGPAVDVFSSSGSTMSFDDVDSTNSANDGINLDGLGTGTFSASTGDIGGESNIGFDLNAGSGDVSYAGTFNNGSGPLTAEITGRTGGTATLSGQITDNNDSGGGISFTGNTGATAVVTNANNVVDTGTATAINVQNTTIGASGINFKTASSNGATNGIKLDTTGSTGGLNVTSTGSGTCAAAANAGCTGGSIQNSSGPGVQLNGVGGPVNLTRVSVNGGGDDGIQANNVGTSAGNGIALTNSFLGGNGNAAFESGLEYDNVLGISSITNVTSTGNFDNNADIQNTSGTGRFTVDSSTFSSNSTTGGSDGMNMNPGGTATVRALIKDSTFSANRDDGYQLKADGDSTVDLTFNHNIVHAAGNAGAVSAHAALNFDGNTTSDVTMSMTGGAGSIVDGADGSAIIINPAGSTATFQATLDDVNVGTAGVVHSASVGGHGIWIEPAQQPASRVVVKNSHISGAQANGIQVLAGGNSGADTTDVTLTNNVIRTVGNEPFYIQSGANSGDTNDVCADLGGTGGDNGPPGNDFAGQAPMGLTDVFFNRRSIAPGVHLRLPGFDGNAANLTSYIQSRNVGSPTVFNNGQALESGPASCLQPASPTLP